VTRLITKSGAVQHVKDNISATDILKIKPNK